MDTPSSSGVITLTRVIPHTTVSAPMRRVPVVSRIAAVVAVAVAATVLLSGCTGSGSPTPTFTGDGAKYFSLVHERYAKCLDGIESVSYTYNPGGIDPRQIGTVEVSGKKTQYYWAIVTPVKDGDKLLTLPDASTAGQLKSAGC
jgi:hypothetical protein